MIMTLGAIVDELCCDLNVSLIKDLFVDIFESPVAY